MIAMIFEFSFDVASPGIYEEYLAEATRLRDLLPSFEGFEGIRRFESVDEPGSFVAIGYFRDEESVAKWRTTAEHRRVQVLGRDRLFTSYRLRMAEIVRDYGRDDRDDAPLDSRVFHDVGERPDVRSRNG